MNRVIEKKTVLKVVCADLSVGVGEIKIDSLSHQALIKTKLIGCIKKRWTRSKCKIKNRLKIRCMQMKISIGK